MGIILMYLYIIHGVRYGNSVGLFVFLQQLSNRKGLKPPRKFQLVQGGGGGGAITGLEDI